MSSDTYTLDPIDPNNVLLSNTYPKTINLNYIGNFVSGKTYTLKSQSGTTLTTSVYTPYSKSIAGINGAGFEIDVSNSVMYLGGPNNSIKTYELYTGTLINTIGISGETQTPAFALDYVNQILYSSGSVFAAYDIKTQTISTKIVYNNGTNNINYIVFGNDGYVYTVNYNTTFKINTTNFSFSVIDTNGPWKGFAMGPDTNLYYIGIINTSNYNAVATVSNTGSNFSQWGGIHEYSSLEQSYGFYYDSVTKGFFQVVDLPLYQGNYYIRLSKISSFTVNSLATYTQYVDVIVGPTTRYYNVCKSVRVVNNLLYWIDQFGTIKTIPFGSLVPSRFSFSTTLLTLQDKYLQLYDGATQFGVQILINYVCFLEGSKILRFNPDTYQDEYVPVETLRRGDLVATAESGYKAIHSIGHKTITNPKTNVNPSNRLYKFSNINCKEVFEPLYITGEHCTLHREIPEDKRELIKEHMGDVYITEEFYRMPAMLDDRAEPYDGPDEPETIWHFSLEHENVAHNYGVYANGLLVESCAIESLVEKSGMRLVE